MYEGRLGEDGQELPYSPIVVFYMLEEHCNIFGTIQDAKYFSYNGKALNEIRIEKYSIIEIQLWTIRCLLLAILKD